MLKRVPGETQGRHGICYKTARNRFEKKRNRDKERGNVSKMRRD